MREINIVLVEPQIPQNTGNVARTCAVTGAALHLVRPMGFEVDDSKLKRAGLDYWHDLDIRYYESLDDFFLRTGGPYVFFTSRAGTVYADAVRMSGPVAVWPENRTSELGLPVPSA